MREIVLLIVLLGSLFLSNVYAKDTVSNITAGINNLADKIEKSVENIATTVVDKLSSFAIFLKNIISDASKVLAIILGILGAFLWFSGLSPYRGRRLIFSAVLLVFLAYIINFI